MNKIFITLICLLFALSSIAQCDQFTAKFTSQASTPDFDPSGLNDGQIVFNTGELFISPLNEISEMTNVNLSSDCSALSTSPQNIFQTNFNVSGIVDSSVPGGVIWDCVDVIFDAVIDYVDINGTEGTADYSGITVPTEAGGAIIVSYLCFDLPDPEDIEPQDHDNWLMVTDKILLDGETGRPTFRTSNIGDGRILSSNASGLADWKTVIQSGSTIIQTGAENEPVSTLNIQGMDLYMTEHQIVFNEPFETQPNIVAGLRGDISSHSSIVNVYVKKTTLTTSGCVVVVVDLDSSNNVILEWIASEI